MKKLMFIFGLFLLLNLSVFVIAQDRELITSEEDYVTETITCKFIDINTGEISTEKNNCYNSFHYGNIEIPTEEVEREGGSGTYTTQLQYQCEGVGECSITIKGERGAKMKWNSFCLEYVSDARIKSWVELIMNPNLTTIIDGTNKIVEIECVERSVAKTILASFGVLREFLVKLYYGDRLGVRDGYVLCIDGTEVTLDNDAPYCKTTDDMFDLLEGQCDSGWASAYTYSGCDLKNPENDVQIVNI